MTKNSVRDRKPARQKAPRTKRVDPAVETPLSLLRALARFLDHLNDDAEVDFSYAETKRFQVALARVLRRHEDLVVAEAARAPVEVRMYELEAVIDRMAAKLETARGDVAAAEPAAAPRLEAVR